MARSNCRISIARPRRPMRASRSLRSARWKSPNRSRQRRLPAAQKGAAARKRSADRPTLGKRGRPAINAGRGGAPDVQSILAGNGRPCSGNCGHDDDARRRRRLERRDRADRQAAGGDRDQPGRRRVLVDQDRDRLMPACRSISARRWRRNSASPSNMSRTTIPGRSSTRLSKGTWDVTFLPKDPEREGRMSFGPIYEVADATYIVKPGSTVTNFADPRSARRQGRRRQQHDDDARRDRASEERQGHGLPDL